jgi:hypothetical protein
MFLMRGFTFKALLKDLILIYAHLKKQAVEAGDPQLSNDFHLWHQYDQGQVPENERFSWNQFYLYTSAYGTSVRLPLIWFSAIGLLFGCGYASIFHQLIENGLYTSLSASVPFVFNDVKIMQDAIDAMTKVNPAWLFYPLYIGQHLIQGYLLFQIGAAIRNKVKR